MTIEFRKDSRAILICGCEDMIPVAGYSIDTQQQPNHLDIELHIPRAPIIKTLIERVGPDTMRIQHLRDGTARPAGFMSDAILFHRAESHVLQRGAKSTEERDTKLDHALTMDTILFGGDGREQLLAICEAVFRYQFEHNASAAQQKASAYFLSIDGKDAPTDLLNRFEGQRPAVKAGSEFSEGKGLNFRIDTLIWLDEVTVEAEGGYYEGNVSASGNTYRLERQDGTWKVITKKGQWIS